MTDVFVMLINGLCYGIAFIIVMLPFLCFPMIIIYCCRREMKKSDKSFWQALKTCFKSGDCISIGYVSGMPKSEDLFDSVRQHSWNNPCYSKEGGNIYYSSSRNN